MLPEFGAETEPQFSHLLDTSPPKRYSQWDSPLLAKALDGDVPVHQVWRILREHNICLARQHSWCLNMDPEFTFIQVLERAQGFISDGPMEKR